MTEDQTWQNMKHIENPSAYRVFGIAWQILGKSYDNPSWCTDSIWKNRLSYKKVSNSGTFWQ